MAKVLNKMQTQESSATLVMQIEVLQSDLYSSKGIDIAKRKSDPEFTAVFSFLKDSGIDLNSLDSDNINRKELGKSLEKVKATISNLPVLRVKVAHDNLGQEFWAEISSWIKDNLMKNSQFLFDIEVSPEIVGGIVIYWGGKVVDLSLKRFLTNFYAKESRHVFR